MVNAVGIGEQAITRKSQILGTYLKGGTRPLVPSLCMGAKLRTGLIEGGGVGA